MAGTGGGGIITLDDCVAVCIVSCLCMLLRRSQLVVVVLKRGCCFWGMKGRKTTMLRWDAQECACIVWFCCVVGRPGERDSGRSSTNPASSASVQTWYADKKFDLCFLGSVDGSCIKHRKALDVNVKCREHRYSLFSVALDSHLPSILVQLRFVQNGIDIEGN